MSDVIVYNKLSTEALVRFFAAYSHAVLEDDGGFEFQIPRENLIAELERMHGWLTEVYKVLPNGNGHR